MNRTTFAAYSAACLLFSVGIAQAAESAGSDQPVTDSYITTKIKAELTKDKVTKAHDIHVATKDGVVSLTGTVSSAAEKEQAGNDAQQIKGVLSVQNYLIVR